MALAQHKVLAAGAVTLWQHQPWSPYIKDEVLQKAVGLADEMAEANIPLHIIERTLFALFQLPEGAPVPLMLTTQQKRLSSIPGSLAELKAILQADK